MKNLERDYETVFFPVTQLLSIAASIIFKLLLVALEFGVRVCQGHGELQWGAQGQTPEVSCWQRDAQGTPGMAEWPREAIGPSDAHPELSPASNRTQLTPHAGKLQCRVFNETNPE